MKMDSEDYSTTENSSLHVERGQQDATTRPHFATAREGHLQVPVPCAVVIVVIITILTIAVVTLSVGQYNCPDQYMLSVSSNSHVSSCSEDWIEYQEKCYFFSTRTGNWTSAQNECSLLGATLGFIDSVKEMNFLKWCARGTKYWIGLRNEAGQAWKWSNGKDLDNWFNFTGSENCGFLNTTVISSTGCEQQLTWICSKPSR